ncbi:Serpin superfamily [Arabidopsis suecica]|uniref:Serpin superfamily n=2 Tax=Arabidopsis TaxID=3701 RepID=A0A8T2HGL0_ARASU|nr:Serpin superfamily [Arabidopsis suecica]
MKKQNDVAMILARHVLSSESESNVIFSPASINSAITMHAAGPGGGLVAGEILSFRELSSIVYAESSASGGPKMKAVNGLWIEKSLPIDPKYKDLFENFFKAVYVSVDFRSKAEDVRKEVNSWVEHHTNNLIKDLLPRESVTSRTNKIYANALYFKGAWKRPFEKYYTKDRDFHLVNGTTVSVPFMTSYETQKKDGLDDLLKRMASTPGFLDSHIPRYKVELEEFRIPKFKIEFGFSATSVLNQVGVLHSVSMYHKACVEIDEEGAEAAAATADVEDDGCALDMEPPPKKIDFVADHPFIFLIREDKTGTVLFVGQLFKPSEFLF